MDVSEWPRWVVAWVVASLAVGAAAATAPAGRFVRVAHDDVGGHYFSQIIYAPTVRALVTWGTRSHSKPIRAHETQHFPIDEATWLDAWPAGKAKAWTGKFKRWPDWQICQPAGSFYQRDGVDMPRPNSSFYQVCWDGHNKRLLFYVGSMTFSYEPKGRQWKRIHARGVKAQPPALLLWGSLCYDPVNRQVLLFGGGGIDSPDGRPHTWAMDVTKDTWRGLDLAVEPPARCNSRMVYDKRNRVIVLFGGDAQDRALADTWVFDVTRQQWRQRKPPRSPSARSCHAMAYLEKSGRVLLVGGNPVADYRVRKKLARQAWVYDVAAPGKSTWTPLAALVPEMHWASMESIPATDEVILVTASRYGHGRETFRFRYDPSIPPGEHKGVPLGTVAPKTDRTPQWYADVPPPDRAAHEKRLAALPVNQWVEVKPPKSAKGRTWGTAVFDTDRGVAMKWGGGHSGYQGTDMAFYDVAANRFTIDRAPAMTPDPFDRWARRPAGRTYFNQPWTRHARHTCAYDRLAKLAVFTDAGGSEWYDRDADAVIKHTWLYDPKRRCWLDPIPQPFRGGGTHSPIAVATTGGVMVYQYGKMYRFAAAAGMPRSGAWREVKIEGALRPPSHEHMTMVHDSKRDRLIFLSDTGDRDRSRRRPQMWFFGLSERRWVKAPLAGGGCVTTREAVYVPDQDAVLAYGPGRKDDPVWTRAYLCAAGRWVPIPIPTPRYLVHEVALVYDPGHKVAVLLWPPRFERDIRPHLLRLDVGKLPR